MPFNISALVNVYCFIYHDKSFISKSIISRSKLVACCCIYILHVAFKHFRIHFNDIFNNFSWAFYLVAFLFRLCQIIFSITFLRVNPNKSNESHIFGGILVVNEVVLDRRMLAW